MRSSLWIRSNRSEENIFIMRAFENRQFEVTAFTQSWSYLMLKVLAEARVEIEKQSAWAL
jgi:hypothetical protein